MITQISKILRSKPRIIFEMMKTTEKIFEMTEKLRPNLDIDQNFTAKK